MISWKALAAVLCLCIVRAGLAQPATASAPATRNAAKLTRESIDPLVSAYLSALADADDRTLLRIVHFQSPEDRSAFIESLRIAKLVGQGFPLDRSKTTFQVALRHSEDHSVMRHLVATKEGYLYLSLDVVVVDDQPKIRYSDRMAANREKSPVHVAADSLRNAIRSWQDAEGSVLKEKAAEHKGQLQDYIAALSLAKRKGLRMVAGSGSIEEGQRIYDSVKSLSDTQLRTAVLKELEARLTQLDRQTQPS